MRAVWYDAASRSEWAEPANEFDRLVEVYTVGYVTQKTKRCVTLAASINALGHVGDRTTIPRGWIASLKAIKVR